nr:hypothetical protein [Tanacetum cinerariifolium]
MDNALACTICPHVKFADLKELFDHNDFVHGVAPEVEETNADEMETHDLIKEAIMQRTTTTRKYEAVQRLSDACKGILHETMTTVNQGMSVEEIELVVAQRVANAIEAIAIYETKTNLAHKMRASKLKIMKDATETTTKLRNKKIGTLVECRTENKKRAYTARHGEKKHYSGSKPLCSKCNYHHDGPCVPKCHQCNKFGHLARECRSSTNVNTTNIQKGTGASQKATCYECGNQGHYKRDCPERKNQNHENQIKSTKARGVVHAFRGGEIEPNLNNIEDEIEA